MDDGGTVSLNWKLRANPDDILSLDTDRARGVELLRCSSTALELLLPEKLARHAAPGHLIVGSYFEHGCKHLYNVEDKEHGHKEHRHLYHRVEAVDQLQWVQRGGQRLARARLRTRELDHISHAFPGMQFEFSYMPSEAMEKVMWPEPRTGKNSGQAEEQPFRKLQERAADNINWLTDSTNVSAWKWDGGDAQHSGGMVVSDDVKALLNFKPRQIANFGWNWDFELNMTKDAEFNYSVPGTKGFVLFKSPYIKMHAGISLKFRSIHPEPGKKDVTNTDDFFGPDQSWIQDQNTTLDEAGQSQTKPEDNVFQRWEPHVQWQFEAVGHGVLKGRMVVQMDSDGTTLQDPTRLVHLPIFKNMSDPMFFAPFNFAIGNFPVSLYPGAQFRAKLYHTGMMRGTLQMGTATHMRFSPRLSFDSKKGLLMKMENTEFRDTTVWPPNWMISTDHFQMGCALEPTIWLKGHVADMTRDSKLAADMRPFFNVTISRTGAKPVSNDRKQVVTFPYRVTGLTPTDPPKKYTVKVQAKVINAGAEEQKEVSTLPEPNFGEVQYHDRYDAFTIGRVTEKTLSKLKFNVVLSEVDESGNPTQSGTAEVTCGDVDGEVCMPNPTVAEIGLNGQTAKVYLHMLWSNNPLPWFVRRLRGVSVAFPQVLVNKSIDNSQPVSVMFSHTARAYPVPLTKAKSSPSAGTMALKGDKVIELGPNYLSSWESQCSGPTDGTCMPKVALYQGTSLLGTAKVPQIPWHQLNRSNYQKEGSSGYQAISVPIKLQPASLLPDFLKTLPTIAVLRMEVRVSDPWRWNRIFAPYKMVEAPQGGNMEVKWTTIDENANFDATIYKKRPSGATGSRILPMVGDGIYDPQGKLEVKAVPYTSAGFKENYYVSSFSFDKFEKNDQVIVGVEWASANGNHSMYSQPILITESGKSVTAAPASADNPEGGEAVPEAESQSETTTQAEAATEAATEAPTQAPTEAPTQAPTEAATSAAPSGATQAATSAAPSGATQAATSAAPSGATQAATSAAPSGATQAATSAPSGATQAATAAPAPSGATQAATSAPSGATQAATAAPAPAPGPSSGGAARMEGGRRLPDVDGNGIDDAKEGGGDLPTALPISPGADCKKQDLSFTFGSGLLFRARVADIEVPENFPVLGAIRSLPDFGTGWVSAFSWSGGQTDLREMLPELLCRDGACEGTAPGCPDWHNGSKYYPQIHVNLTRHFDYGNNQSNIKALREIFAYAFAILPETINVIATVSKANLKGKPLGSQFLINNNSSAATGGAATTAGAAATSAAAATGDAATTGGAAPAVTGASTGATASEPSTAAPATTPTITGADSVPVQGPGLTQNLTRRLAGTEGGHNEPVKRISISFPEGLHYKVDRKLMDEMMRTGMFDHIDDGQVSDKGHIGIHSYYIEGTPEIGGTRPGLSLPLLASAAVAVVAACAVVAGVHACIKRVPRKPYEKVAVKEEEAEGRGDAILD